MHKLSVERLYSKRAIKLAGRILGQHVKRTPEVEEAFRILHNWRLHHAYPMVRERAKLTRTVNLMGGVTAGRLKRTASIRKKLFRGTVSLDELQDVVGCRAILKSMDDLREVHSKYHSVNDGGHVRRSSDYIQVPKRSGYRSIHLVIGFSENGVGAKHSGCKVELQLRTQLQHVWATTVEAAGSMRNEDLKAGEGDQRWLRFLTLMSGHIAELEGQPRGDHLSISYRDLRREARDLAVGLNVRQNLSTFSEFMHAADIIGGPHGSTYMLKMNTATGDVQVTPAWREIFNYDDLDDDFEETKHSIEVSADNMSALRHAYPNYFADTHQFLEILEEIEKAGQPRKYGGIDKLDLSFLPKKPKLKKRVLHLDYTGIVYWGEESVGRWEKGFYEEYFFDAEFEKNCVVRSKNLADFKEQIEDWLENR